jgi:hypothetical protein
MHVTRPCLAGGLEGPDNLFDLRVIGRGESPDVLEQLRASSKFQTTDLIEGYSSRVGEYAHFDLSTKPG